MDGEEEEGKEVNNNNEVDGEEEEGKGLTRRLEAISGWRK